MRPSSVTTPLSSSFVSSYDIHKPDYLNRLFKGKGSQGQSYSLFWRNVGFDMPAKNDTYKWGEEDWMIETFHSLNIVAAPGVGNPVAITLMPTDINSSNDYYPRVGDGILFDGGVVGVLYAVDETVPAAPIIYVRPNDAADAIPAIAASQELSVYTNMFSEGSGQPVGRVSGILEGSNDAQIFKESLEFTGTEEATASWFTLSGQFEGSYVLKEQEEIDYRQAMAIDGALTMGKRITNTALIDPNTNKPYKATEGVFPVSKRLGNTISYTYGAYTIAKFNEADRLLERENAADKVVMLQGTDMFRDTEDALVSYFPTTGSTEYVNKEIEEDVFGNNADLAASIAFKNFKKSGRIHMFGKLGNLSNQKTFSAGINTYNRQGVTVPIAKKRNKVTDEMESCIGIRYRACGGVNRRSKLWFDGANAPTPIGDMDVKKVYQRAHLGAQHMGVNQFIFWQNV